MAATRTIKKYPNRRLYDTELSRYITLADLRRLIADGEDFEVVDANSGEDITRTILLQIITDQECAGKPLFTTDMLLKMIRFYGGGAQDIFTDYLQRSLELFSDQQKAYQEQWSELMRVTPVGAMSEIARRNVELWQDVQRGFLRAAGSGPSSGAGEPKKDKPKTD